MSRILLSANTSWYLHNYRLNTIRSLVDRGDEVICVAPQDDYSARLDAEPGVRFVPLKMDNQGSNPLRDIGLFWRLFRNYRRLRPDAVCHFTIKNNVFGTIAAALAGIPAINNVSGLGTAFIHSGWLGAVVRLLYRASQPLAFRVFCQNEEDFELLVEKKLVARGKLQLLPGSGVDLTRFRPTSRTHSPVVFRFLFLGRMLSDKGVEELVGAFRTMTRTSDCELWLAGFSDSLNKSAISEVQLRGWENEVAGLNFKGPTDSPEMLLAQVDCVVLPSYREGLPRALLEAGAMELPVIATDVPGCRSVVRDGVNGLLCAPADVTSLRIAMEKVSGLPVHALREMGIRGREHVERNYDERSVIRSYMTAIDEAVG